MINAEIAPIEARLRAQISEMVRSMQSDVFESFEHHNATAESALGSGDASSFDPQRSSVAHDESDPSIASHRPPTSTRAFFREPQHLDPSNTTPALHMMPLSQPPIQSNGRFSDSGYDSASQECQCICHMEEPPIPQRGIFSTTGERGNSCSACSPLHAQQSTSQLSTETDLDFDLSPFVDPEAFN